MKLVAISQSRLQEYVKEVLTVIANDDVGVTADLLDITLVMGELSGLEKQEMDEILERG